MVWGTRDPTAICATMLISGSMGMYSNAITDNYSLRHVCCLTYEFVHVCKCVCVWLASVVLISHQSSWCQTDWQSTKNHIHKLCVHVFRHKEFLSKAFCLQLVFWSVLPCMFAHILAPVCTFEEDAESQPVLCARWWWWLENESICVRIKKKNKTKQKKTPL